MCELGEFDTIFLAQRAFVMPAFSYVIDLDRLVTRRSHAELSLVIVIDGLDVRLRPAVLDVITLE
jgi:hypothetical protein